MVVVVMWLVRTYGMVAASGNVSGDFFGVVGWCGACSPRVVLCGWCSAVSHSASLPDLEATLLTLCTALTLAYSLERDYYTCYVKEKRKGVISFSKRSKG